MRDIHSQISDWANKLAYWEQTALRWLLDGKQLTETDHRLLLDLLLEDANLIEKTQERPKLSFQAKASDEQSARDRVTLIAIGELENVNALVPNQQLEFCKQLTAVFGANGSGKSGYARVLGSAAFTRGDRDVLRNVMVPHDVSQLQRALVTVANDQEERIVEYRIGHGCPELAGFYMFDSTAVRMHVSGENAISFSPVGLAALPVLAETTDRVRELLAKEIETRSSRIEFAWFFEGESIVKELVTNITAKTDLEQLRTLTVLSPLDEIRFRNLDKEIAELRLKDTLKTIEHLKRTAADLEELATKLEIAENALTDGRLEALASLLDEEVRCQLLASQLDVSSFASEDGNYVGTDSWLDFVKAAQALAQAASIHGASYPQPEDHCLLCQQRLSPEASRLIQRLWQFLDNEVQEALDKAREAVEEERLKLKDIDLDFFQPHEVWYRFLQDRDQELVSDVESFLVDSRQRRAQSIAAIGRFDLPISTSRPQSSIQSIRDLIEELDEKISELEDSDPAAEIQRLEGEQRNLQHRITLQQHLDAIVGYVANLLWVERAKKIGGSTRHITRKYNELFDELVTQRYIQLFQETLTVLGRSLQVEVRTKGRKGQVIKQVVVRSDATAPAKMATPEKVLSEGEKRAVALADFLTEVALDSSSRGIILDDPVTSLDLEWRQIIASILAKEAQRQQVIVFTHDLPFLHYLLTSAAETKLETRTHWIKRGDYDGVPGYVFLDNSPALEGDYKSSRHARECYLRAKSAPPQEQERILRDGFGALRTSYEAFIIFELFNSVVLRFGERISFGRLEEIVWDNTIVKDVITSCERLSRCIEGHLHSDSFLPTKPTPAQLLEECEHFDALKSQLKALRKQSK